MNEHLYRSRRLARVPEETYAHMVEGVVRETGVDPEEAEKVVAAVLGPAMLAPPREFDDNFGCRWLYWAYDGVWVTCLVTEPGHDQHVGRERDEHWQSSDPRSVEAESWEAVGRRRPGGLSVEDKSAYLAQMLATRAEQTYDVEQLGDTAFVVEVKERGYRVSVVPVARAVDLPEWVETVLREQVQEADVVVGPLREFLAAVVVAHGQLTEALRPSAGMAAPLVASALTATVAELGYQVSGGLPG